MGQFCETLQHLLWIMESPLILEWLHFSLSFQKRRKASKKPDNSVSPYKHFEDNSQMTTVSELYRASANENGQMGQMGSQLGTCSTCGTGKETASGESCRGTQPARSSSAHPLLLLHLHLSSSVFSQPAGAAQTWESSLDLLGCCVSQSFSPADTILGVFALEGTQRQFSSNFTCGWPTFHPCPPSPE